MLTSISLIFAMRNGLSEPLRGETGVLGREPSLLMLRDGVGGTEPRPDLPLWRVRDSLDRGALYFLEDPRRLGVVERGRRV